MSRTSTFALAAFALAAAPAVSATPTMHATLHVNPGLWEVTVSPKMSGQLPISDAELARIPAERRAKFMAAMQSMVGKPHKMKECITQEKLSKGFQVGRDSARCTSTVVTNTASAMEIRESCPADQGGMTSVDVKFMASSPTSVIGTTHVVAGHGGKTMTVDSTVAARWIGAGCGAIKDVEIEN